MQQQAMILSNPFLYFLFQQFIISILPLKHFFLQAFILFSIEIRQLTCNQPFLKFIRMFILHISLFLILLALIYYVLLPYISFKIYSYRLPPETQRLPFVPFLGSLGLLFLKSIKDHRKNLAEGVASSKGSRLSCFNLMRWKGLMIYDPKLIKSFSQKQTTDFIKERSASNLFVRVIGKGLIFSQLKEHAKVRKLVSDTFSFEYINSVSDQIAKLIIYRLSLLKGHQKQVLKVMNKVTSEVIMACFLGMQLGNDMVDNQQLHQFVSQFIGMAQKQSMSLAYLAFGKVSSKFVDRELKFRQVINNIIESKIEEIKKTKSQRPFLIQSLYNKIEGSEQAKTAQITEHFLNFFFAGTDTSSHLISVSVYYLIKYPQIKARILAQLQNISFDKIDFNWGKDLACLNAFIKEVQRTYGPVNTVIMRQAIHDVYLQDVFVPKGTILLVNSEINHHREQYFKQPFQFSIDRWLNNEVPDDPFVFLPFSAGQRNCIGQHLALFQTRISLAYLLKNYRMKKEENFRGNIVAKGLLYFDEPFNVCFQS